MTTAQGRTVASAITDATGASIPPHPFFSSAAVVVVSAGAAVVPAVVVAAGVGAAVVVASVVVVVDSSFSYIAKFFIPYTSPLRKANHIGPLWKSISSLS